MDVSVQWAMKAEKSTFWRVGARRAGTGMNQSKGDSPTPRESIMAMRKGSSGIGKNRSEEYVSPSTAYILFAFTFSCLGTKHSLASYSNLA